MELLAGTASGKEVIDNEGILQKARVTLTKDANYYEI